MSWNIKKYMSARDLSWKILLDGGVHVLPVQVSALCRSIGITVKLYSGEEGSDGESAIIAGQPLILVNRNKPVPRQRFTAAHELGHIMLGHVGEGMPAHRGMSPEDEAMEQEANVFASRLLAPACVLWGCGVRSAEDIVKLCDISRQAAEFRWQRFQKLQRRERFLTSPLEQRVLEQFRNYIERHKLSGFDNL